MLLLRRDVAPLLDESVGLGRYRQVDGRPGRGPITDEVRQVQTVVLRLSRGADDIDDVVLDLLVDVDFIDDCSHLGNVARLDDRPDIEFLIGHSHTVEDLPLLLGKKLLEQLFGP